MCIIRKAKTASYNIGIGTTLTVIADKKCRNRSGWAHSGRFLLIFTNFSVIIRVLNSKYLRGLYAGVSDDRAFGISHQRVVPIRQEAKSI